MRPRSLQRPLSLGRHRSNVTRRTALVVPLIVLGALLLAGPILLALQGGGTSVSPSPTATAGPTGGQDASRPEPITELQDAVWWRTGWLAVDDVQGGHDFGRLTIGGFDGEVLGQIDIGTGWVPRGSGPPFIVGPEMGLILYTTWEGRAAQLHLVDTRARVDRVILTRRGLYHAALAPASGSVYVAAGAPEAGIWRIRLDGGGAPELVASPPEVVGLLTDAVLTAPIDAIPKQVTLLLDEAESRLAVYTCTDACHLRVIDLEDMDEFEVAVADATRELTDFIGDVVVIEGGAAYDVEAGSTVPTPDGARVHVFPDVGWEVPDGYRVELRPVDPAARLPGPMRYVVIDPAGRESPVDAMGQAVVNG